MSPRCTFKGVREPQHQRAELFSRAGNKHTKGMARGVFHMMPITMPKWKRWNYVGGLCGLLLLLSPVTDAREAVTDVNIDIPYTKFVLKNGLTLIVHEDHKANFV